MSSRLQHLIMQISLHCGHKLQCFITFRGCWHRVELSSDSKFAISNLRMPSQSISHDYHETAINMRFNTSRFFPEFLNAAQMSPTNGHAAGRLAAQNAQLPRIGLQNVISHLSTFSNTQQWFVTSEHCNKTDDATDSSSTQSPEHQLSSSALVPGAGRDVGFGVHGRNHC